MLNWAKWAKWMKRANQHSRHQTRCLILPERAGQIVVLMVLMALNVLEPAVFAQEVADTKSTGAERATKLTESNIATSSKDIKTSSPTTDPLDTPAQAAFKKIPKDFLGSVKPKRFSLEEKEAQEQAAKFGIDEIRVYALREPEEVSVSKRPPILAFRDKMDRERPMTPKEKAQLVLCFIGLCGANYGPEGILVEDKAYSRGELNSKKSTLELSQQFRGTLQ